jgi:phosphoserine aminotransferase
MTTRAHNFSAGPAAISTDVLVRAQRELLDWHGTGTSILEMSHRDAGGPVQGVLTHAEARLRELLAIPSSYRVLFLHGGAHGQFAAVPMNLAGAEGATASYLVTGFWSERAREEASRHVRTEVAADSTALGGLAIPEPSVWRAPRSRAYLHLCANETIHGLELLEDPVWDGPPLVADFTSTLLSRPVDIARYGVIHASSGKNLGPAGVTVVIVRDDLLARRAHERTPAILDWSKAAGSTPIGSLHSTPPVFAIYFLGLVLDDLVARGGLSAMATRAKARAEHIYAILDGSAGLYTNRVEPRFRSRMNVPFRVAGGDPEAERRFTREGEERGLFQLFGHPRFGGQRITLYNGVRDESVDALATFLEDFARRARR